VRVTTAFNRLLRRPGASVAGGHVRRRGGGGQGPPSPAKIGLLCLRAGSPDPRPLHATLAPPRPRIAALPDRGGDPPRALPGLRGAKVVRTACGQRDRESNSVSAAGAKSRVRFGTLA